MRRSSGWTPWDSKANEAFPGYLVRKDLVRRYARQYPVPTYVVEFLLGRYCASVEQDEIDEGLEIVKNQLEGRTVRAAEQEIFKSRAREEGSVRLIDILRARLDAKNDCYLAELPSLGLRGHPHRKRVRHRPSADARRRTTRRSPWSTTR